MEKCLSSRETSCITMSSSYHNVKIANSVREDDFISLATKLESSWSHHAIFRYIFNQCTTIFYYGITINRKKKVFILKWIYDFVKNVDVWQLPFSKIFQPIFRNKYVASIHFASLREILRNSYEHCKRLKFREGRWFCNVAFTFA